MTHSTETQYTGQSTELALVQASFFQPSFRIEYPTISRQLGVINLNVHRNVSALYRLHLVIARFVQMRNTCNLLCWLEGLDLDR